MQSYQFGKMELKFAQLIWEHAPISSGELVKLCQETLEWKKSTTYTMLRRLCDCIRTNFTERISRTAKQTIRRGNFRRISSRILDSLCIQEKAV